MCGFKDFTMDQDLPSAERFACSLILREIEMPATCSEILEPWQKSLIFGPLAKSCFFVKTRNSGHGRTTVPTVVVGKLSQKRGATPDERNSYSKFPARCSRWNAVENILGGKNRTQDLGTNHLECVFAREYTRSFVFR